MDAELAGMVRELHARQSIRDVLANYSRGIDRRDRELLLSCYHADAIDDHGAFVGGREAFWDWLGPSHLMHYRTHQHSLTNHSCQLDGDGAHSETYWMFAGMTHHGDALTLFGGRYIDRFEKRDGRWAIAARKCVLEWWGAPIDGAVTEEWRAAFAAGGPMAKDRTDCSYERLLAVDPARIGIRLGV